MKYNLIYKIFIFVLFLSLFLILGSGFMLGQNGDLLFWQTSIYSYCLLALISSIVVVFFRPQSSEALRLDYEERKINENKEQLQQQQQNYESRLQRLILQEEQLKQKLMQYQQYAEFPDDYQTEEYLSAFDEEITHLLHDKAEIIFDKIIHKKYTEQGEFKHSLLLADVVDLIESVARLHHPDSEHPLLETSVENLLRSLNRLSLQLLVLVDRFPVNIKEYNLRKTYLYVQKSAIAVGYYKKAEPFLSFVTPVLRIGMASNPMIGVAQSVAIEAGKQMIKKSSEKYALTLLHDIIEIIGAQATTIFGEKSFRYRNKNWIYALELAEIIHHFSPVNPTALSQAMRIISGLQMHSEYDRIFLYQCLAQNKIPELEKFDYQFLTPENKQEIAGKLKEFVENSINKDRQQENDRKAILWRKKLEQRLKMEIQLNIDRDDSHYLKNMLSSASPEKKVKPFLARYILEQMQATEIPQFIYTDISFEITLPLQAGSELCLLGSNRRLILLEVDNTDVRMIWQYETKTKEPLLFQRIKNILADDCRISGGEWLGGIQIDKEPEFVIRGKNIGSYESYFQALESFRRLILDNRET